MNHFTKDILLSQKDLGVRVGVCMCLRMRFDKPLFSGQIKQKFAFPREMRRHFFHGPLKVIFQQFDGVTDGDIQQFDGVTHGDIQLFDGVTDGYFQQFDGVTDGVIQLFDCVTDSVD